MVVICEPLITSEAADAVSEESGQGENSTAEISELAACQMLVLKNTENAIAKMGTLGNSLRTDENPCHVSLRNGQAEAPVPLWQRCRSNQFSSPLVARKAMWVGGSA